MLNKALSFENFTLVLILVLCFVKIKNEARPYPAGDAIEYSLMTEAFKNHFTPDVRVEDCESFKASFIKVAPWAMNDKAAMYDKVEEFIATQNLNKLQYNYAFFVDKDGKKYSVHFFLYSLFNVPASWFCSITGINPLYAFALTNASLIILTCFFFFQFTTFNKLNTSLFVLLFFFSSNYWYMCWQHPEVFTVCFASLGAWLFLSKRYYLGVFLVAIAALQNQPLSIVVALFSLLTLFLNGINFKNIYKIALSSCLTLLPSLFYFYHFGESNLIKFQGALSFDYVTFTRVFGFFFDLNQGVILAIPFILLLYIGLLIRRIIFIKNESYRWDLLIPLALIIAVCFAATINNWNHGQAVISRYATYISGIILVHTFFMTMQIQKKTIRYIIISLALITQIYTINYHQDLSKFDWSTNEPKPISNFVLNHFPAFYNPDPIIFINRYSPKVIFDYNLSPVYYMKPDGNITKFLVNKNYIGNLEKFGIAPKQIDSISSTLNYINDWAYINVDSELKKYLNPSKIKAMDNDRRISEQIAVIKSSPEWYDKIRQKAVANGISEEETLRRDAAFVLGITITSNMTKKEKVMAKIEEIKADKAWLKLIEEKAKQKNISIDSVLYSDAEWMVDQEIKK